MPLTKVTIYYQWVDPGMYYYQKKGEKEGKWKPARPKIGDETLWVVEGTELGVDFPPDVCYSDTEGWLIIPSKKRESELVEKHPELEGLLREAREQTPPGRLI
jgi:hypothetical protein